VSTRESVKKLLEEGAGCNEIAVKLGFATSSISYHIKKLGRGTPNKHFDWKAIQSFYDEPKTRKECMREFGFKHGTWTSAVSRGDIVLRTRSQEYLKSSGKFVGGHTIKRCLKDEGVPYECSNCSLNTWDSKPISLQVDHIDGNNTNNKFSNLRLLCPNCHSKTSTFAGRNRLK